MKRYAKISACGLYRNRLIRTWYDTLPIFMIIGLNPSTADGKIDDPTNIRCVNFAKREGCGTLVMENLADYRATSPKDMMRAEKPCSDWNLSFVKDAADITQQSGGKIACAWGSHGGFKNLDMKVLAALLPKHELLCFGVTKGNFPKHPLYLKSDTPLETYVVEL